MANEKTATQATLKQSRFSYARLEGVMLSTRTSWDELTEISGVRHLEHICKTKGLTREALQPICEYMECDPAYIFMETNDPKIGEYKGFRIVTEKSEETGSQHGKEASQAQAELKDNKEPNNIVRKRVEAEIKRQGWVNKIMVLFFDAPASCTSVSSQLLHTKTLPLYTTDNLSWLLGVTKEYLEGKTDDPQAGTAGVRHKSPHDTFPIDLTRYSTFKIKECLGVSFRIAKWLKAAPRYVHPAIAEKFAECIQYEADELRASEEDIADISDDMVWPEKDNKANKTSSDKITHKKEQPPQKEKKGNKDQDKNTGVSFKPVLALLQSMDNSDLEKAEALIKAMKELGTQVSNDDFVKLEMFIETQRDFNNAQQNRLDALSMFS